MSIGEAAKYDFLASFLITFTRVSTIKEVAYSYEITFQVIPKVEPWPLADLPWGLTGDYYHLGVTMVIDDPRKWEGPKILMVGGTKAMFKFVHNNGPIMVSVHLYDHAVSCSLKNFTKKGLNCSISLPGQ